MAINASLAQDALNEISRLSTTEFVATIKPLMYFVVGMTIYALFVFKFYRFLARRDILQLKTHKYYEAYEGFLKKIARALFYVLENLILIPLFVFFWFAVLAGLLLMLSKATQPDTLLLTSSAIVAAVRITAYYNENLSQDLAKMIPFALLGVFLIDVTFFSLQESIAVAKQIPGLASLLIYYLAFATVLEFILRISYEIVTLFTLKKAVEELS